MSHIEASHDVDALTMTFTAEFDAPPERVWQVWEDPRQLERWWGPPTWPATFTRHEPRAGGRSEYHMTGPDGERAPGYWDVVAVDPPNALSFVDGFRDQDGSVDASLPTTSTEVTLTASGTGTRMVILSRFASAADLERLLEMGMEDGMGLALGQIDEVLAAG
jgi:uncharacterized protein YndB with AHSA1/START domain